MSPDNLSALRLSLQVAVAATALNALVGIPVAYVLARRRFWGRSLLDLLVTLPLVLMLLDWWPLGRLSATRPDRSLLNLGMEKAPFFALAVADGLITFWAQRQAGAVKDLAELPLMERAANAFTYRNVSGV